MPGRVGSSILQVSDGQPHPADRAAIVGLHLVHAIRIRFGRRAVGDHPNDRHRPGEDRKTNDESDRDDHSYAANSRIVPLAVPPPSHIAWSPYRVPVRSIS